MSTELHFTPEICERFSYFKDAMKQLRKLDDNIILQLNTRQTLESTEAVCVHIREALAKSDEKRRSLIKYCRSHVQSQVDAKKETLRLHPDDVRLKKSLEAEETKLKWIENESQVDRIIRQRTTSLINDRCRFVFQA